MSILFAISIVSFCALLWATLAIAHHIRVGHKALTDTPRTPPRPPAAPSPWLHRNQPEPSARAQSGDQPRTTLSANKFTYTSQPSR